jgi:hypothetical protein
LIGHHTLARLTDQVGRTIRIRLTLLIRDALTLLADLGSRTVDIISAIRLLLLALIVHTELIHRAVVVGDALSIIGQANIILAAEFAIRTVFVCLARVEFATASHAFTAPPAILIGSTLSGDTLTAPTDLSVGTVSIPGTLRHAGVVETRFVAFALIITATSGHALAVLADISVTAVRVSRTSGRLDAFVVFADATRRTVIILIARILRFTLIVAADLAVCAVAILSTRRQTAGTIIVADTYLAVRPVRTLFVCRTTSIRRRYALTARADFTGSAVSIGRTPGICGDIDADTTPTCLTCRTILIRAAGARIRTEIGDALGRARAVTVGLTAIAEIRATTTGDDQARE